MDILVGTSGRNLVVLRRDHEAILALWAVCKLTLHVLASFKGALHGTRLPRTIRVSKTLEHVHLSVLGDDTIACGHSSTIRRWIGLKRANLEAITLHQVLSTRVILDPIAPLLHVVLEEGVRSCILDLGGLHVALLHLLLLLGPEELLMHPEKVSLFIC